MKDNMGLKELKGYQRMSIGYRLETKNQKAGSRATEGRNKETFSI
jgi:hypothetical protein